MWVWTRVALALGCLLIGFAACSGSDDPSVGGDASGASGAGGNGGDGGEAGTLEAGANPDGCLPIGCPWGYQSVGTCGCEPIAGYCGAGYDHCRGTRSCPPDMFSAPGKKGCCGCRPLECAKAEVACVPCARGEEEVLLPGACCPVCIAAPSQCAAAEAPCADVICAPGTAPTVGTSVDCCSSCDVIDAGADAAMDAGDAGKD